MVCASLIILNVNKVMCAKEVCIVNRGACEGVSVLIDPVPIY